MDEYDTLVAAADEAAAGGDWDGYTALIGEAQAAWDAVNDSD